MTSPEQKPTGRRHDSAASSEQGLRLYYAGSRPIDFTALPGLPARVMLSYHDIATKKGWFIQRKVFQRILKERR